MSNTDSELFELCKEVYEKTGWRGWELVTLRDDGAMFVDEQDKSLIAEKGFTVLYTSDYLLEKLPRVHLDPSMHSMWRASYGITSTLAETPLKALLKLTLVLHEAGEL